MLRVARIALLLLVIPASYALTNKYNEPHFLAGRSTIVELRDYHFLEIAEECTNFLGPKGFAGVQIPPIMEHYRVPGDDEKTGQNEWMRYEPISYDLISDFGGREEFVQMASACNAAGVRVYVEMVLNHMSKYTPEMDSNAALSANDSIANAMLMHYPDVPYTRADFHTPCQILQPLDAHEVRNCQVEGRPDLNHSLERVRKQIVKVLNKLVAVGVAGFYIDAAKHMWPVDLKRIYNAVQNLSVDFDFPEAARPFFYQNVFDLGNDSVSKTEYIGYGMVSEYLYAIKLWPILNGAAPLSALINWGPAMGFVPHTDAVVFVTDRNLNWAAAYVHDQRKYLMSLIFMLVHPYGHIKRITAEHTVAASPETNKDDNVQRLRALVNTLQLANSLDNVQDGVINFQTNGQRQIAFCRGRKAFIAINNEAEHDYAAVVQTCLDVPGIYCDVISGGRSSNGRACNGAQLVVKNEEGLADLHLAPASGNGNDIEHLGILAICVDSKLIADEVDYSSNDDDETAEYSTVTDALQLTTPMTMSTSAEMTLTTLANENATNKNYHEL